jgi:hypothetical protein
MPQYVIVIYVTTQDVDKLAKEVLEISFESAEVHDTHIDEVYEVEKECQ